MHLAHLHALAHSCRVFAPYFLSRLTSAPYLRTFRCGKITNSSEFYNVLNGNLKGFIIVIIGIIIIIIIIIIIVIITSIIIAIITYLFNVDIKNTH